MTKILTIPDIHGQSERWEFLWLQNARWDKIIFLGDYVDNVRGANITDEAMMVNLENIIRFKRQYPNKAELLLGNHDISYSDGGYSCSRNIPEIYRKLRNLFYSNRRLFKIAHAEDCFLWTHAGVSKNWLILNGKELAACGYTGTTASLADALNNMMQHSRYQGLLFSRGPYRGGADLCGGPLWADMQETTISALQDVVQVVGHTPVNSPDISMNDSNGAVYYRDCLGTTSSYMELELPAYNITEYVPHALYMPTDERVRGARVATESIFEQYLRRSSAFYIEAPSMGMTAIEPENTEDI